MESKHYICNGNCKGVSETPGLCQAENCDKYHQHLTECSCSDGLHSSVLRLGKKNTKLNLFYLSPIIIHLLILKILSYGPDYGSYSEILYITLIIAAIVNVFYSLVLGIRIIRKQRLFGIILILFFVIISIFYIIVPSLTKGYPRGVDAAIKANTANIRARSQIIFEENKSFENLCSDSEVLRAINGAEAVGSEGVKCFSDVDGFVVVSKLIKEKNTSFCVDSKSSAVNISSEKHKSIVNADTLCN